jgi:Putative auto-transporter adhesin, head GIN domain
MKRTTAGLAASLLVLIATLVGGCSTIIGDNGPVRTEQRDVSGFTKVNVGGGSELTIAIGSGYHVEITAEEQVLAKLRSTVDGGRLTIDSTGGYTSHHGVQVRITMPALDDLELSGGATGKVSSVSGGNLAVTLSGGAEATVSGSVDRLAVEASGGSRAHLRDLSVTGAEVSASGGAQIELTTSGRVSGSASGGSIVDAWGGGSLSVETSGGSQARAH